MPTSSRSKVQNPKSKVEAATQLRISVCFHSYFKDLTGCAQTTETVPAGSTIADLLTGVNARFPKLSGMRNSTLVAVGVEYQPRDYVLGEGDEVSLFPPVQGG